LKKRAVDKERFALFRYIAEQVSAFKRKDLLLLLQFLRLGKFNLQPGGGIAERSVRKKTDIRGRL
jgi:hypothetical protein